MADLTFTATSTRYVWLPFRAIDPNTGEQVDTSGATLKAALTPGADQPDAADWAPADVDGQRLINGRTYDLARVLVGASGAVTPAPGLYRAWVRVELGNEVIEEPCGLVRVT